MTSSESSEYRKMLNTTVPSVGVGRNTARTKRAGSSWAQLFEAGTGGPIGPPGLTGHQETVRGPNSTVAGIVVIWLLPSTD
jgi:hypothetical protein